jgi:predicted  nucleic acid-binding Zn-ribbon protein
VNRSIAGRTAQQLAELQDHDLRMIANRGDATKAQAPTAHPADRALPALQQVRASMLREIPEPWRGQYERITARYGRAVVPVRDQTCLGCYAHVPAGLMPRVRDLPAITRCEGCGRLLLWLPQTPSRPDRTH